MKIGFIGAGNMGGALATAAAKAVGGECLLIADANAEKAASLAAEIGAVTADNATVAAQCDYIFLGVKPQMMKDMLLELPNFKKPKKLHEQIINLSHKEEECDKLYLEATMKSADFSTEPLVVMFWRDIFERLEKCADACEHVGDSIETIVMKNS